MSEAVNHPVHYGGENSPYEVVKVAEAWGFDKNAYLFNVLKYIRREKGNTLEDLKKARWYLDRLIGRLELPVSEAPVSEAPVSEAPVSEAPVSEAPVKRVSVTLPGMGRKTVAVTHRCTAGDVAETAAATWNSERPASALYWVCAPPGLADTLVLRTYLPASESVLAPDLNAMTALKGYELGRYTIELRRVKV